MCSLYFDSFSVSNWKQSSFQCFWVQDCTAILNIYLRSNLWPEFLCALSQTFILCYLILCYISTKDSNGIHSKNILTTCAIKLLYLSKKMYISLDYNYWSSTHSIDPSIVHSLIVCFYVSFIAVLLITVLTVLSNEYSKLECPRRLVKEKVILCLQLVSYVYAYVSSLYI